MASIAAPTLLGNATAAEANEAFPDLCLHEEQALDFQGQQQEPRTPQAQHFQQQYRQIASGGQVNTSLHNYPTSPTHQHYQHYQVPLAQHTDSSSNPLTKPAEILNRPSAVSVSSFSASSFTTDSVDVVVPVHVVDHAFANTDDFDSRRASVISAASTLSSLSSSSSPPLPSTATLPDVDVSFSSPPSSSSSSQQQQRPLTRSRRDAKQLHAARVQRSASVALGDNSNSNSNSKDLEGIARRDTFGGGREAKDWDWTSRRAGSTSPSPVDEQDQQHQQQQQQQQQQQGGLARMAFAEQQRWIKVQEKTFTKWLNTKLQERDLEVKDLVADLSDGVMLIHLLECLSNESLGRYAAKPKLRVQRFENANLSLNFIKSRGIQMTNIGAEDVVDGNRKIILGLIWTLISRFTISDINEEGMTAKEGLLLWCQRKTACYDEVDVRDFSASWNDGLAFCALLDIHRPDLIDYDALDKNDRRGNMQLAFDLAHREIGIPKLLDVEDVCDVAKPDDLSLMTYIAYWFHAFSQMEKVENAGRRVEKFVNNMQGAWEMQSAYERRVAELLRQIRAQMADWRAATFAGTYADAKAQAGVFASYKRGQKRQWVAEKSELATLLGNIKTKLGTYRLRPYEPPAELRLEVMDREWTALTTAEMSRGQLINETIRDIKNNLRRSFADKANDFAMALNTVQLAISGLEGDVEDQLHHVRKLSENLPPLEKYLSTIEAVDAQCVEANIEENDFTTYTYDELTYELGLVKTSVSKKLAFLENQMVARSMTNLTPIQLEEFESVFRHFDRDDSNALQELEFSAALASLGLVFSEEEMHDYFVEAASTTTGNGAITIHKDRVSFEQFIRFMVEVTEDQNTAEQVFQSFREVADGKPYVTEMDLRHSLVPDEVIDKLVTMMPRHEGPDLAEDRGTPQYDYITFMDKMMGDLEPSSSSSSSSQHHQQQQHQQPASATPSHASTFSSTSSQQQSQQQYKHNSASSSVSSASSYTPSGSQSPRKLANGFH
ncbi:alpha-actinin [Sporothrix bragantina]|uniref:Alpha-actinin n=1 Tax=Sporothrix bragantina TaxID=671064 RepID=A0ABP0CIK0_9PEZI